MWGGQQELLQTAVALCLHCTVPALYCTFTVLYLHCTALHCTCTALYLHCTYVSVYLNFLGHSSKYIRSMEFYPECFEYPWPALTIVSIQDLQSLENIHIDMFIMITLCELTRSRLAFVVCVVDVQPVV